MTRKTFSAAFKSKVALEAIKGHKTINEISSEYDVHATQINKWRKQLVDSSQDVFSGKSEKRVENIEAARMRPQSPQG